MPSDPREIAKQIYDTVNDESQPVKDALEEAAKILQELSEEQLAAVKHWIEKDQKAGFLIDFLMGS